MDQKIKALLKDIIKKVIKAVQKQDSLYLRKISNYSLHNASVYQDQNSVAIAVITYALSKIIERPHKKIRDLPYFWKELAKELDEARLFIDEENVYKNIIKDIFNKISKIDEKLALYIEEVIDKARITKGSKIYEHGISLARAAEILGVSEWELMNYVGKTRMIDQEPEAGLSVHQRLGLARALFRV